MKLIKILISLFRKDFYHVHFSIFGNSEPEKKSTRMNMKEIEKLLKNCSKYARTDISIQHNKKWLIIENYKSDPSWKQKRF